ncbi:MAG: lipopolysaccharide transport periplasmic protein LptA [Gallionellaceae bacterium]|nr:lipopolysaccharide transport periplasmic protein LptA [Gallionellaceae bacterium]
MNPLKNKLLNIISILLIIFPFVAQAEKNDRNQPIHIESDRMNVDDAAHVSTFEGRVVLTQGSLRFTAEKLVVTEDAAGNKFCVATGRLATFRQKRDDANEYVEGYGERIEYSTATETVNFYTQARVKRDQDDVRGDHITYSTQTEVFHVSGKPNTGRVRATIQPKNKVEPAPAKTITTKIKP